MMDGISGNSCRVMLYGCRSDRGRGGTFPRIKLSLMAKKNSVDMLAIHGDGNVPVSRLCPRLRNRSSERVRHASGKPPERALCSRWRYRSVVTWPSDAGRDPAKLLFWR